MNALIRKLQNWDSHHRLMFGLAVALLAGVSLQGEASLPVRLVISWDAFTLSVLVLAWLRIVSARPKESLKTAKLQDSSRTTIFIFVMVAAVASIFAVCHLLGSAKGRHGEMLWATTGLAFGTLMGSWSMIHTLFALRYAHLYYGDADGTPLTPGHRGGLDFPSEKAPDYLDFAYFAFVVGMTCQVSDVQITARPLRRLALLHGILSFVFNTVILAISINIASGLFS